MSRALYRELSACADALLGSGSSAHAGLVHEKYVDAWELGFAKLNDDGRKAFLQLVAALAGRSSRLLEQHLGRRARLAAALEAQEWRGRSLWRLVAGMGRASALEIGFCWDHLLGVPRLPGSSVKGAVRAWAQANLEGAEAAADVERVFGPERAGDDERLDTGSVVWFDAYPTEAKLDLDVMNVHHKGYYDSQGAQPPTGTEGPTPLFFLAAAATEWTTYVAPRPRSTENAARQQVKADAARAREWLNRCAGEWGLGAKTSAGYGYFQEPAPKAEAPRAGAPAAGGAPTPAAPAQETWEGVALRYSPGDGTLAAAREQQRALASRTEQQALVQTLTEEQRARLTAKGGPRRLDRVDLRVEPLGRAWRIMEILRVHE